MTSPTTTYAVMPDTTIENLYAIFLKHSVICTDTRKLTPGCLFFALKGESFNGNLFAMKALEGGAAFAIIDEDAGNDPRLIQVPDVLTTLQQLATHHRRQFNIPVIAIAGSNGKTTTKELMAAVLNTQFNTLFTQGNLNNHIGVPLTLLSLNKTHEWAVIEIGANHRGENAMLCEITEPDMALVTNVGKDHLEGFGGIEGVKLASKEVYDYMKTVNGKVFIQSSNKELTALLGEYNHVINYGPSADAGTTGTASVKNGYLYVQLLSPFNIAIQTQLAGTYNLENVLAAVAVGHYAGISAEKIASGIEQYVPGNQRSQILKRNDLTILMDAYNANPSSMEAALKNFGNEYPSPRRIALGEMLELGPAEAEEHLAIAELASENGAAEVILVGNLFKTAAEKFSARHFSNSEAAANWLKTQLPLSGSLLVKGSRGTKMEKLLEGL
jgi:UDP-N-acetylmuramoyl-tripeptide--D-alanyl-D-alanine ligase